MSDNGHHQDQPPPADVSPIVPGRPGRPSFSLEALRERVERQFQEETAHRSDILIELDTDEKRREMLRDVMDYVLAMEAVTLTERDKRGLLDTAYRNLFSFGPLDDYLRDETVTEITINGPYAIHVRRGLDKLMPVPASFDDQAHLEGLLERVLATGGAALGSPFLEVGVTLAGRAARLGLIAPPVSPTYQLEIRLHPPAAITLDDLHTRLNVLSDQAAHWLMAILAKGHGLLIVGDAGLGKTTLAGALAHTLPAEMRVIVVERAAEMNLPERITRRAPNHAPPGSTFADEVQRAQDEKPDWLIADEMRGDESAAVYAALMRDDAPRYLCVFRGDSQPDRLRSALGFVLRKANPAIEQAAIHHAIARHWPFVAALKLIDGVSRLHLIAEWVEQNETLDLRPILVWEDGRWQVKNQSARLTFG